MKLLFYFYQETALAECDWTFYFKKPTSNSEEVFLRSSNRVIGLVFHVGAHPWIVAHACFGGLMFQNTDARLSWLAGVLGFTSVRALLDACSLRGVRREKHACVKKKRICVFVPSGSGERIWEASM